MTIPFILITILLGIISLIAIGCTSWLLREKIKELVNERKDILHARRYSKEDMWRIYQRGANKSGPRTDEWAHLRRQEFESIIKHWPTNLKPN